MRGPSRFLVTAVSVVGLMSGACGTTSDSTDGPAADVAVTSAPDPERTADADPAASASGDIVVFAAASLTGAFDEIGDAFMEANPGAEVTFNFAASSELAAQVLEGAPADVFASADLVNMAKVTDAGDAGDPVVFANNLSEIIVAPGNPLAIGGVDDLADTELILVVCAPEVPCGSYAAEIFARAGVELTPDSFEQNVKAVVTKVILGEADAGIAYATDVGAAGDAADGVEIPADLNVVAAYPMAVTSEAPNPDGAQSFIDFVLGESGQGILAGFGFGSP